MSCFNGLTTNAKLSIYRKILHSKKTPQFVRLKVWGWRKEIILEERMNRVSRETINLDRAEKILKSYIADQKELKDKEREVVNGYIRAKDFKGLDAHVTEWDEFFIPMLKQNNAKIQKQRKEVKALNRSINQYNMQISNYQSLKFNGNTNDLPKEEIDSFWTDIESEFTTMLPSVSDSKMGDAESRYANNIQNEQEKEEDEDLKENKSKDDDFKAALLREFGVTSKVNNTMNKDGNLIKNVSSTINLPIQINN
jgi:hypothetical protein